MEAAGEWAQAVSLPRPRLLEALRDDHLRESGPCGRRGAGGCPVDLRRRANPPRANISLDTGTLAAIDEEAAAHGLTRLAFMASAALEKSPAGDLSRPFEAISQYF